MQTVLIQSLSIDQGNELLFKLESAGFTDKDAQLVIDAEDNKIAIGLVKFLQNKEAESVNQIPIISDPKLVGIVAAAMKRFQDRNSKPVNQTPIVPDPKWLSARNIMGKNFFGVEENVKYLGVRPDKDQLEALAKIPFTEAELKYKKNTHVLIADFQLSIMEICERTKLRLSNNSKILENSNTLFANNCKIVSWHLIQNTRVDNSIDKTWDEQQKLLGLDEVTPNLRVLILMIGGIFVATGERLFEKVYVRSSDDYSDGRHAFLGFFGVDSFNIDDCWDNLRSRLVGISAAVLPKTLSSNH